MSIRCGNHETSTYHADIDAVRACFAGATASTPRYEETYLTDAALERIAEQVRQDEADGILPRRSRPYTAEDARRDLTKVTARTATVTAPAPAARLSPKGREIPAEFGGSPKQYDFMFDLVEQAGVAGDDYDWAAVASVRDASNQIGALKAKADAARSAKVRADYRSVYSDGMDEDGLATTDGIFRNPTTGEIFKGQFNRAQGDGRRLYFKRLVITEGDWDDGASFEITNILLDADDPKAIGQAQAGRLEWRYAGGPARAKVQASWILSREEAAAFGKLYGVCVRCHRDLTKEESIERAMGPVCAGKQGW